MSSSEPCGHPPASWPCSVGSVKRGLPAWLKLGDNLEATARPIHTGATHGGRVDTGAGLWQSPPH